MLTGPTNPSSSSTHIAGFMFIDGQRVFEGDPVPVYNKYSNELIGTVPMMTDGHREQALEAAVRGAETMRDMPAHRRSALLQRVADYIARHHDQFSRTIAVEAGKALKHARVETDRAISTFQWAAEEAKRLHGETIPLDAVPAGEGFFGYYVRTPVGVVLAITPFNFPLNLVSHKVGPALAAGNSVVLKPATRTPFSAVLLAQAIEEAGFPPGAFNLVFGEGPEIAPALADPRVNKISFTGSPAVGEHIVKAAGIKKVTLELGNNSPVIIHSDADIVRAVERCVFGSFYNAGQVCISVQRIYVHRPVYESFLDQFVKSTEALVVGDPLDENTDVGPMISEKEAERLEQWIREAVANGARVACGGARQGALFQPTILTGVDPSQPVSCQEAFGPVVVVGPYDSFDEALQQAGDTEYGLQVGVFTRDIQRILRAVHLLNYGGVIINEIPSFRTDHMPYGGNKRSGLGREGVRFAMEEMTNLRTVAIHLG